MSNASRQYAANLQLFANLRTERPGFKLDFNQRTGLFSITRSTVGRTLSNLFASREDEQSVTNNAMFSTPIREVFAEAVVHDLPPQQVQNALDGLRVLRDAYRGSQAKSRVLNSLLGDLREMTTDSGTLEQDVLRLWQSVPSNAAASLILFNGETDRQALLHLFRDARVQRHLARLEQRLTRPDAPVRAEERYDPHQFEQLIYSKYNEDEDAVHLDPATFASLIPHRPGVILQGVKYDRALLNAATFGQFIRRNGRAFIYFGGANHDALHERFPGQHLWRVYLNVKMEAPAIAGVMEFLGGQADRAMVTGLMDFKISGPDAVAGRCDKVVVYVVGLAQAERLAARLAGDPVKRAWFRDPTPQFTRSVAPGIALGTEPTSLLTGFESRPHEGTAAEQEASAKRKSFGSIRAALIATAASYYVLNKRTVGIGEGEDVFVRWVAVVFRQYMHHLHPADQRRAKDDTVLAASNVKARRLSMA